MTDQAHSRLLKTETLIAVVDAYLSLTPLRLPRRVSRLRVAGYFTAAVKAGIVYG